MNKAQGGHEVVRQEVESHMREAAKVSETLGDLQENVRLRVAALADGHPENQTPEMEHIRGVSGETQEQVRDALAAKEEELKEITESHKDVGLTTDLAPGVNGQTMLEQPDAAVVHTGLVGADLTELKRTTIHEHSDEVGHASHVAPNVPNPDAAIIHRGEAYDVVTVFEGYVERGVSIEMGEGDDGSRPGQPEHTYARGQRLANDMIAEAGEGVYMTALRETGRYGDIQKKLWEKQVAEAPAMETFTRIIDEANRTGHHAEARSILLPYLPQMRQMMQQERQREEEAAVPMPA